MQFLRAPSGIEPGRPSIRWKNYRHAVVYRSPESLWPQIQTEMVEKMIKLEAALKPFVESLEM